MLCLPRMGPPMELMAMFPVRVMRSAQETASPYLSLIGCRMLRAFRVRYFVARGEAKDRTRVHVRYGREELNERLRRLVHFVEWE